MPPATSLPSTHSFTSTPVDLLASYTPPQVSATTSGDDPELATLATSYTYNGDRQVTAIDAPEGTSYDVISKGYDSYGRLSTSYDPLSSVTATYEYVLNGSGVSTDQVGSITTSDAGLNVIVASGGAAVPDMLRLLDAGGMAVAKLSMTATPISPSDARVPAAPPNSTSSTRRRSSGICLAAPLARNYCKRCIRRNRSMPRATRPEPRHGQHL